MKRKRYRFIVEISFLAKNSNEANRNIAWWNSYLREGFPLPLDTPKGVENGYKVEKLHATTIKD